MQKIKSAPPADHDPLNPSKVELAQDCAFSAQSNLRPMLIMAWKLCRFTRSIYIIASLRSAINAFR